MNFKRGWKKFWYLLTKDESLKGWIFAVIFLFIFIKLIFFPLLNLIAGTTHALSIVESCSMHHDSRLLFFHDFDKWWKSNENKYSTYNLTKNDFKDFKLKNGFTKGDILFVTKATPEKLKIGDIILFNAGQNNPIIHRIINIKKENEKYLFTTIGDNNPNSLTNKNNPFGINEINIKEEQLVGKLAFKIAPYIGWSKLIFYDFRKPESLRGLCDEV